MADPSLAPELLDAVARLIVPDLRDDRPGSWDEARELARPRAEGGLGLGGFLTFGGDRETLPVRIASVREAAGDRELLFFSDLERGAGQQVRGFTLLPHLMALGAADDESLCEAAGELTAREAIEAGIDCAFAPCIDLNTDPENPIINVRAFGDDPQVVARLSAAWVRGCRRGGALSCAKHYPGHGDVTVDSHTALPHLGASLETLEARELVPFRALSAAGVDTVMIGHLACPALTGARAGDPVPVTISPRAMGYLRETMGYEGLIVTDALFMGGLTAHLDELDASVL
ncbi:MAG: glycoside hydrolase family 3 N-terminal domain-containing protein, partial [Planctomycetota bacterium]